MMCKNTPQTEDNTDKMMMMIIIIIIIIIMMMMIIIIIIKIRKPNIHFHIPPPRIILETHHMIKVQIPAVSLSKSHSLYTGCPRRNVPNFGTVFLMLNYTDITQNTYVQS